MYSFASSLCDTLLIIVLCKLAFKLNCPALLVFAPLVSSGVPLFISYGHTTARMTGSSVSGEYPTLI